MKYHEQIAEVYDRIAPHITRTPVLASPYFSQATGSTVVFKCESLQLTSSFKVRGAFSKITAMPDKNKTLVCASGGNHGMAVSFAASKFGMKAIVVVPEFVPQYRIDMIAALGGEVVVHGKTMDDLNAKVGEYTRDPRYVYLHPFDDDQVIAGQATVGLEIVQQAPDIDAVIVSIGGGGLISGIAQYVKSFDPRIRVYGVQTIGADAMYRSLAAGTIVAIPAITSIATSLGATRVSDRTFDIVRNNVDRVVTVTDDEALITLRDILAREKLLVEPAASCSLAALTTGTLPDLRGKKVAVLLCGGNVSLEVLKQYI